MAIGDIPKIPMEHIPRVQKLIKKIRKDELTLEEAQSRFLSVLGRMKISSAGVTVSGDYGKFELETRSLRAMLESAKKAVEAWPLFKGREFFLEKDGQITRITLGLLMKKKPAARSEVESSTLPVVIVDPKISAKDNLLNKLEYEFQGLDGRVPKPPSRIKIRRIEEFAGWFGEGWVNFAKVLAIGVPSVSLTTKSVLDKLGEPVPSFSDLVLKKCGV